MKKVSVQDAKAHDVGTSVPLSRQLCFAVYSASLVMAKHYKPLLAPLGLTYPQYFVMTSLWEHGEQTVGTLGDRLWLDSGTLTPLLKRLEGQGLVSRERDPADERRVVIRLLPPGRRLRVQARDLSSLMEIASGRSVAEIDAAVAFLNSVRDRLAECQS